MANHNVTIYAEPGEPGLPPSIALSSSIVDTKVGDTVTYTVPTYGGSVFISSISGGLSSTRPAGSSIPAGSSVTVTVLNTGTKTVSFAFFQASATSTIRVNVPPPPDPDPVPVPFTFTPVTGASLGQNKYSNTVTITGINVPVLVSASNGAALSVDGGGYTTREVTANPGDTLKIRMRASPDYKTQVSTTVYVKYKQTTRYSTGWSVTTLDPPDINSYPQIPVGGLPVSMSRLDQIFGKLSPSFSIKSYYKGGTLVPNLTVNSSIPTSGTIKLSDFAGSANAIFWDTEPSPRYMVASLPDNRAHTFYATWYAGSDYYVGYSTYLSDSLEYRVTIDSSYVYGMPGTATPVIPNPNAFSVPNKDLRIKWQIPNSDKGSGEGSIRLKVEARAIGTTSPVLVTYATLEYRILGDGQNPM